MFNSILRTAEAVTSTQAVALREVRKVYGRRDGSVVALDGVTVGLARGSFTALMGLSGSGKSTFLNVATGRFRSANCQRRPRARMPVPTSNQDATPSGCLVPLLARCGSVFHRSLDNAEIVHTVHERPAPTIPAHNGLHLH
jgi:ABC-type transporter Mla maintaining outer membrane lipid asymmetry ATPase subunit MlaF